LNKLQIFATEEEMNIIEQAKSMEKEQIIDARINGDMNGMCIAKLAKEKAEHYYNKTFKSE
jgi:hypothetical protein